MTVVDHARVADLLADALTRCAAVDEGTVADYIPALAQCRPDLFGIAYTGIDGGRASAGDASARFSIQSISKPFVFALVCGTLGGDEVARLVGVNSTGLPFNSMAAPDPVADAATNAMMNAGAIAVTSLVPGGTANEKWQYILAGLSAFAGRTLTMDDEVYRSEASHNAANQRIARAMDSRGRMYFHPLAATDVYTRQCAVEVTVEDLSVMGATLANAGRNPVTGVRAIDPDSCRRVLALLATAGLYERTGEWLYRTGLPAKSGVSGGLMTVSPTIAGLAAYSPPLDRAGNSVRAQLAVTDVARALGLGVFDAVTDPAGAARLG